LILLALYAIPAFVVVRPVGDNDIWMNLKAGQWIVDHASVPAADPFRSHGESRPWVAYSWLFEVLVHGLDAGLGLAGVVVYRVVLSYAVLVAIHRLVARREPRFVRATGLTGLAFFALVPLLNERTWLFTLLFTTLTLDILLDLRAGMPAGTAARALPLVYALWANLHIQFIYGLLLLGLACAAPLIDRLLPGRDEDEGQGEAPAAGTRAWYELVALGAACLAATLVNPYHARLYAVVLDYATQAETYNLVLELLAPSFRQPWEWAIPVLLGGAAFALGRRRARSSFDVLLLAAAAYLALRARRDAWLAVLGALAILTTGPRPEPAAGDRFAFSRRRVLGLAAGVMALLIAAAWSRDLSPAGLASEVEAFYPARAARVVEERGLHGPLFNEYGWGSYLIWRLDGLPVSIDGRADLHGPGRIRRNAETVSGLRGWEEDPDLLAANTIILGARTALASLLRRDPRYALVHEDPVAVLFVRREECP
jgi:hypothetical protein